MKLDIILLALLGVAPLLVTNCPKQFNRVNIEQLVKESKENPWKEENLHKAMATYHHDNKTYNLVLVVGLGMGILTTVLCYRCGLRMVRRVGSVLEEIDALRLARNPEQDP